ncbi:hypothetical protein FQA39_LY17663 [Lamprigera yunnana]|nr:hypothetical protein FQA39_LY17663 [Lamprigera yunnana]
MNERGKNIIKLLEACKGGERSGFYYIKKEGSDIIGNGVGDKESEIRVDAIIRANKTEVSEKGKRIHKGVEDMITKLAALGIKEIGAKEYGRDKPKLVGRILEYSVEGVNKERVINKDTMFVKLKDDASYADTLKKAKEGSGRHGSGSESNGRKEHKRQRDCDKAYGEGERGKREDGGEGRKVPVDGGD